MPHKRIAPSLYPIASKFFLTFILSKIGVSAFSTVDLVNNSYLDILGLLLKLNSLYKVIYCGGLKDKIKQFTSNKLTGCIEIDLARQRLGVKLCKVFLHNHSRVYRFRSFALNLS
jgi:hypothetical protein